ncbi:MAG: DNA mismatch repair protein MutS [Acidobacteriota bacterium]|nr:DNA mismatch repair protein MutS [Acidobacteriota bacterium]
MANSLKSLANAQKTATPAMKQYFEAKRQHPNAIVFFRMGDFFEMFYEDAVTAATALELTLTSRSKDAAGADIPMCGVPHHAADAYLNRLIKQGFRVAICDQVEDAKKAKGLVRRDVVRVVTPGTLTDVNYLDAREPAYVMALSSNQDASNSITGIAIADLSTGEFRVTEIADNYMTRNVIDEIRAVSPKELILPANLAERTELELLPTGVTITAVESWTFGLDHAFRTLTEHFGTSTLEGFGLNLENNPFSIAAAGAALAYLQHTQRGNLDHIQRLDVRDRSNHLSIDPATFQHLEILKGANGDRTGSLIQEIDETKTPMGGRLLRAWLARPLCHRESILRRLDSVDELVTESITREKLRDVLSSVHDLERLIGRVILGRAGPRDLVALKTSLKAIPSIRDLARCLKTRLTRDLIDGIHDLTEVQADIDTTLIDTPPAIARDGGMIRDGVDHELDETRSHSQNAKQSIAAMESSERDRTGINSLKVKYNRVFGYYIEVSKANLQAVPDDYQRKQTIANGERFVTPALKEYARKALGADDKIRVRELELFTALTERVAAHAEHIQSAAHAISTVDVLLSFSMTATHRNYCKPVITAETELTLTDARHPVVERRTESFIPNDLSLNSSNQQLMLLTGPNMGGKSTYLRQTAIIVLMAHTGSFVPAKHAVIPVTDRIFARVGASDDIARGQSTFMIEMQETARILNLATSDSLVLLDEIGRGTATFDGLSLAWAVAEHLVTNDENRPRTLFATHYHELTELAEAHAEVSNFHVAAREWKEDIVFLHKVEPGRSDRSYGIQVARLAGLPASTIARAKVILAGLEGDELSHAGRPSFDSASISDQSQMGLFEGRSEKHNTVIAQIAGIDLDQITPVDALQFLAGLKDDISD